MSRPLAAKGAGACLKHVLNTRLSPRALTVVGQTGMVDRFSTSEQVCKEAVTFGQERRRG